VRFLLTHPPDPRPALVVETVGRVDTGAIDRLRQALLRLGCPNGLLFDADACVILRDRYTSLQGESIIEDGRIPTDRVLARMPRGRPLEQRVSDWLRSMATNWDDALPKEQDVAAPFITDIVPAVSGSSIRQVA
jgi:hypothetical protein